MCPADDMPPDPGVSVSVMQFRKAIEVSSHVLRIGKDVFGTHRREEVSAMRKTPLRLIVLLAFAVSLFT
jgi:hypothetical protein